MGYRSQKQFMEKEGVKMVKCSTCPRLTRETMKCSFYNRTISIDDLHLEMSCPGHPNSKAYCGKDTFVEVLA